MGKICSGERFWTVRFIKNALKKYDGFRIALQFSFLHVRFFLLIMSMYTYICSFDRWEINSLDFAFLIREKMGENWIHKACTFSFLFVSVFKKLTHWFEFFCVKSIFRNIVSIHRKFSLLNRESWYQAYNKKKKRKELSSYTQG